MKKGSKHLKSSRDKMSKTRKGVPQHKQSLETRIKISIAKKGVKKKPFTEEHRKHMSEARIGSKSHFWKGGKTNLTSLIRECFKYRQWRSDVFTRDNFTCQECGKSKGGKLQAHHIESLSILIKKHNIKTLEDAIDCEELWNINNGQTLCIECHKKTDSYLNNYNK